MDLRPASASGGHCMNDNTLLFRQVNPSFIQQGRVSSQAFRPTTKDNKKLSTYDGDQITPLGSWKHFTQSLGYESIGVLALTVRECTNHELPVGPDPSAFPAHVLVDFSAFTKSQIQQKSKQLLYLAQTRGWLHQIE